MDPLVRQTALEVLLSHQKDLSDTQLKEALRLGLADPDFPIAEIALKFMLKNKLVAHYLGELKILASRLTSKDDPYLKQLGQRVEKIIKLSSKV